MAFGVLCCAAQHVGRHEPREGGSSWFIVVPHAERRMFVYQQNGVLRRHGRSSFGAVRVSSLRLGSRDKYLPNIGLILPSKLRRALPLSFRARYCCTANMPQPPLQFYLWAIASQRWSDVSIITFSPNSKELNPAFAALEMMQLSGLLGPNVDVHKVCQELQKII